MASPTPQTTVRPAGMHEFVLEVADLAASTRFYAEIIGLKHIVSWSGDRPAEWFDCGDTVALGLWPVETGGDMAIAKGRGGAHVHFALRIPRGTIEEAKAAIVAKGVPIVDDVLFDDGNRSIYVDDPDGNCVELMAAITDWSGNPVGEESA